MTEASALRTNTSRSARRPAARPRPARRRAPRGLRPEPRFRAVRDRPHDLRGAGLPGRRLQPLPAGVGRLHRQHRPRQRGDVRDAARRDLRLVGLGAAARGSLRAPRGLLHPATARSTGPTPSSARATCPTGRSPRARTPGCPGDELFVPVPALRRAPARHRLGRRAGVRHAAVRRPARPARGHGVAHRARPAGRPGGGRGRAPPHRARAAAAGLLAPVRAPLDRRGAAGGLRRRLRRAGLPEGR